MDLADFYIFTFINTSRGRRIHTAGSVIDSELGKLILFTREPDPSGCLNIVLDNRYSRDDINNHCAREKPQVWRIDGKLVPIIYWVREFNGLFPAFRFKPETPFTRDKVQSWLDNLEVGSQPLEQLQEDFYNMTINRPASPIFAVDPWATIVERPYAPPSSCGDVSVFPVADTPPGPNLKYDNFFHRAEERAWERIMNTDGTVDRLLKKRPETRSTMAVFIHAGAGYHSFQNEKLHLAMCAKAAQEAMKCLKAGGNAVDAVEVAIRVLENNDITNAGFGSNLSVDGTVECDATVVDHFGRSGACGAVPNIKNPISLAKLILNTSSKTLSLRRVPPNILVGEGAKRFATEHGMSTVSNNDLASKNAVDRYRKWCDDLAKAEARENDKSAPDLTSRVTPPEEAAAFLNPKRDNSQDRRQDKPSAYLRLRQGLMRDHSSAILTGTWNEGQPDSPVAGPGSPVGSGLEPVTPTKTRSALSDIRTGTQSPGRPNRAFDLSESPTESPAKRRKTSEAASASDLIDLDASVDGQSWTGPAPDWDCVVVNKANPDTKLPTHNNYKMDATELTVEPDKADHDLVTDTMGAIAIDQDGNIAAGSSSGGIGMKHMGRIGPAALVGVGTAVMPKDPKDEEGKCVAAVTSGTGEHMATTMAARKCAERLYYNTKPGFGGSVVVEEDENQIMNDFVLEDFMGHPGVMNQGSPGAIGVMAVKVTTNGIYLNWAHNTDSFALAGMASYEKEPMCCMSRLRTDNSSSVNIGARKLDVCHPIGRNGKWVPGFGGHGSR